jgi:dynein heavy chain
MALDMGLMQHVELCVQVGEQAQKEYQIETILKGM